MSALLESERSARNARRCPLRALSLVAAAREVRDVTDRARDDAAMAPVDEAALGDRRSAERVDLVQRPSLRPLINATGVVLHTNLGRAPLPAVALVAIARVAGGYSNLEYDLDAGTRGSRYTHCAALLRELTGADDALVVNNCAAALVLALNSLSDKKEAVLSRGELVEIGGSFRIHDIMAKSGARLREVGATNRTHVADYSRAISADTGAILKVHRSNFAQQGFVADVDVSDIAPIAREHGLPIIHDLGSGLLIPLDEFGLSGEPTARMALDAGASIVVMSGDKLLGGPQAGIILGASRYIKAMRENPLARSYRVDKLTLAALEATLALYREPSAARREIPTLALIGAPVSVVYERAALAQRMLANAGIASELVKTSANVGGGAFPLVQLESVAIALAGDAERWASALRAGDPAVIGRVLDDRMLLDFRAVTDASVSLLVDAVVTARD